MGTVVVTHNRHHHQYCGRNRRYGSTKFRTFGSNHAANFRASKCRILQSEEVLLSTAFSLCPTEASVAKIPFSALQSPKNPLPSLSENQDISKGIVKCRTISVPIKIKHSDKENDFHFSEHWAGPAYSNSPFPSSLPIPKFSLQPRRTASLEFHRTSSEVSLETIAKSAPASPTRKWRASDDDLSKGNLFEAADSATMTLRRILNLDMTLN